jgi:sigma-B regulation protein RsbU (phosphoserine phosphatase)
LRRYFLIFLGLIAVIGPARAAVAQDQPGTQILVDEDDGWRVHPGDDAAYADPKFDDSSWQQASFVDDLPEALGKGDARWFRKRIVLPMEPGPIDLLLIGTKGSFEVYVDGERIGGPIVSSLRWRKGQELVFPLRNSGGSGRESVEVAIRSHLYPSEFSEVNFEQAVLGTPAAIEIAARAHQGERVGKLVFPIAILVAMTIAAVLILALFYQQPAHREYLWLGLTLVFFALTTGLPQIDIYGGVPYSWNAFLGDPCTYFFIAAELEFIYSFIGRRPGRFIRFYQAALILVPLPFNPLMWIGRFPNGTLEWVENTVTLPAMILVLFILVRAYRAGSREAGLLILPTIFANAAGFLFGVELIIQTHDPSFAFPSLNLGLVRFNFEIVFAVPYLLSIGLLMFLRYSQVSRDQAQSQAELDSARTIQQILVPERLPEIPGFHIESVYHPAQQVGGDFFQVLGIEGGGVLAVLGDVSGKGLPAAMNVALLVGTLRTLAETTTDPAQILAGLNRRLLGRSKGFTTAVAVRIAPDGEADLAIAGHLNPYLNGRELVLETALPLGLTEDAVYANAAVTLAVGDTLTLLTDGVLEARDAKTQELFGFDRTLGISGQPAQEIAAIAQRFGQEDDIAVLTIAFVPVEMARA